MTLSSPSLTSGVPAPSLVLDRSHDVCDKKDLKLNPFPSWVAPVAGIVIALSLTAAATAAVGCTILLGAAFLPAALVGIVAFVGLSAFEWGAASVLFTSIATMVLAATFALPYVKSHFDGKFEHVKKELATTQIANAKLVEDNKALLIEKNTLEQSEKELREQVVSLKREISRLEYRFLGGDHEDHGGHGRHSSHGGPGHYPHGY